MYMIEEITEDKYEKLTEHIEKGLRYIGKAMQCLDELGEKSKMGHRGGMRDGHDYDDWKEHEHEYGDRRGRYSRY